jgi:hypothetical protein
MEEESEGAAEKHRYQAHRDLFTELWSQIKDQFKPFFRSYRVDKVAFAIQVVNLVLAYIFFYYVLKGPLDKLTGKSEYTALGFNILILVFIAVFIQTITELKILKWQTIFDMNRKLSFHYFIIFICINLCSYWFKFIYKAIATMKSAYLNGQATGADVND